MVDEISPHLRAKYPGSCATDPDLGLFGFENNAIQPDGQVEFDV